MHLEAGGWSPCIIFCVSPLLPSALPPVTDHTQPRTLVLYYHHQQLYIGTFDTHLKQIKTFKPISSRVWV